MSGSPSPIDQGVVSDPDLHSGEPILVGTSTPVRAIVELWDQGMAPEQIPLHLPHLDLMRVFEALHYYLGHRQEIDRYIQANRIPDELAGRRFDPDTGKPIRNA